MKKNKVIIYLSFVLVFVQSCRTLNNATTQDDSPKIKSITLKELMPNGDGTYDAYNQEVDYYNENGGLDSTAIITYEGTLVIIEQYFYNKNNRLDSIYYFERGRVIASKSVFEYDKNDNILVETKSKDAFENKYFYYYNSKNELIEKKGFNTTNGAKDIVDWHKFEYGNSLMIKDADLLDEDNLIRKYSYNKHGDEVSYLSIMQVEEDGYPTEEVYTTFSDYKYNVQGDWIECKAYSQGSTSKHGVFKQLYGREITYY